MKLLIIPYIKNMINIFNIKTYEELLSFLFNNKDIQLIKEIKRNRAYIFLINNVKIYYSYPKITPKKNGFFLITYNKKNNLSIPLKEKEVDFILVFFNNGFYLIPLEKIPISKNNYISRSFRLYTENLIFRNFFYNI
jgi:hypothetical protein